VRRRPDRAANVSPSPGATGVGINQDLAWTAGLSQCPGLTATYDVYFGATTPPPFVLNTGTGKVWDPGTLQYGTTYYWRVVAKDANGSTSSAEWSFTTAAAPCVAAPTAPSGAVPASGTTGFSINGNLAWSGGVSQCAGLTATYDVYFGTTTPPPFDHDNGTSKGGIRAHSSTARPTTGRSWRRMPTGDARAGVELHHRSALPGRADHAVRSDADRRAWQREREHEPGLGMRRQPVRRTHRLVRRVLRTNRRPVRPNAWAPRRSSRGISRGWQRRRRTTGRSS